METEGKQYSDEATELLYGMLAGLKSADEARVLLADVCTLREIEQMAQRIACAKLLLEGGTYHEIISQTDISSTTLSRVSRCLQHGSGGYAGLLARFLREKSSGAGGQ